MLWLPLTLGSAFMLSLADALTKRELERTGLTRAVWLRNLLALPFLFALLPFIEIPPLDMTFVKAVAAALPLEVAATFLYVRAIQLSPLSLTMPFLALTPVYLLISSVFILGEVPSPGGVIGVVLLASGAYLLNLHTLREGGFLGPFRAIANEPGSVMMMAVAAIYAVTSDLGKLAIIHSSPLFFAVVYWALFSLLLTPAALWHMKGRTGNRPLADDARAFLLVGFAQAAMVALHMVAISLTQVSYMIAVKRTSLLFAAGFGYFMFSEKDIRERLAGAAFMLAGLTAIVLAR
jgi:drug/metabolite transporter (DMT)-like permease